MLGDRPGARGAKASRRRGTQEAGGRRPGARRARSSGREGIPARRRKQRAGRHPGAAAPDGDERGQKQRRTRRPAGRCRAGERGRFVGRRGRHRSGGCDLTVRPGGRGRPRWRADRSVAPARSPTPHPPADPADPTPRSPTPHLQAARAVPSARSAMVRGVRPDRPPAEAGVRPDRPPAGAGGRTADLRRSRRHRRRGPAPHRAHCRYCAGQAWRAGGGVDRFRWGVVRPGVALTALPTAGHRRAYRRHPYPHRDWQGGGGAAAQPIGLQAACPTATGRHAGWWRASGLDPRGHRSGRSVAGVGRLGVALLARPRRGLGASPPIPGRAPSWPTPVGRLCLARGRVFSAERGERRGRFMLLGAEPEKPRTGRCGSFFSRIIPATLLTLPGGYPPSTIGAGGLNFRVRDGNGCDSAAMATGNRAHCG